MANQMATMQGCCDCGVVLTNCTEASDWWDTISEASITGLAFETTTCSECPLLDGDYILSKAASAPFGCGASFYQAMYYEFPTAIGTCRTIPPNYAFDFTGFRLSMICSVDMGILTVEFILFAAHGFSGSGCRSIASRSVSGASISASSLMSGSMSRLNDSPNLSACSIVSASSPSYVFSA